MIEIFGLDGIMLNLSLLLFIPYSIRYLDYGKLLDEIEAKNYSEYLDKQFEAEMSNILAFITTAISMVIILIDIAIIINLFR